jgi:hypothetical protein
LKIEVLPGGYLYRYWRKQFREFQKQLKLFEQIYFEGYVRPLEQTLRESHLQEMTNSQIAVYAPVKLDGNIDTDFIKNERELESLKQYIITRKNRYKGYTHIDVRIDKIVKQYEI